MTMHETTAEGQVTRKRERVTCPPADLAASAVDPVLGRMVATAWQLGLEPVIVELLELRSRWDRRTVDHFRGNTRRRDRPGQLTNWSEVTAIGLRLSKSGR